MASSQYTVPPTPRVISPSPTPSEAKNKDNYFGSVGGNGRVTSPDPILEDAENTSDPELSRARPRSRSPHVARVSAKAGIPDGKPVRRRPEPIKSKSNDANGFLSPKTAGGFGAKYWRELSRSPSPFGLIPIHREWRVFIHKHEIPRKVLHVSIGFLVLGLYCNGTQAAAIHPKLLGALIPIFAVDIVRLHYAPFNDFYIRMLGAFMRESEAHDKYNGVISYLGGAWFVMYFCPKDVAVISILMLSWCDTAASTFGRLYGKYTPRIRKGKSLAGSLAAFSVGVAASALFWGLIAPAVPQSWNTGISRFAFQGRLTLPGSLRKQLGWTTPGSTIEGPIALTVMSICSGLIVSVSEAIDVLGLDDNLTIPVLCGIGLGVFLKVFG